MPVTPADVKAVIENYVKAWGSDDRALLLSLFAVDATWEDPVGTDAHVGPEGVGKFWDFAHEGDSRTLTPKPIRIVACANEGILNFTMEVRSNDGRQGMDLEVTDHFVINDEGKIQTARAFWDESSFSQPDGLEPLG